MYQLVHQMFIKNLLYCQTLPGTKIPQWIFFMRYLEDSPINPHFLLMCSGPHSPAGPSLPASGLTDIPPPCLDLTVPLLESPFLFFLEGFHGDLSYSHPDIYFFFMGPCLKWWFNIRSIRTLSYVGIFKRLELQVSFEKRLFLRGVCFLLPLVDDLLEFPQGHKELDTTERLHFHFINVFRKGQRKTDSLVILSPVSVCGKELISLDGQGNVKSFYGRTNSLGPLLCFTESTCLLTHSCVTHLKADQEPSVFPSWTVLLLITNVLTVDCSYLPSFHSAHESCVMLCHGAKIGFFQGDIRLLMDDLKALQPTVFPVVPRLLNRMFDRIFGQANTTLKRWLLDFASKRKEAELRSGIIRNNSLWDKLIFHKIQSSLGGKVRLMITGAAPVSATVLTFLRAALGCQFYEGYGQTECTAGCCLTIAGDWTAGHVGAPMPCSIIKLVDVEEMNYLAAKGEGEVCVKGSNVFQGYLKDPVKTAEALDKDGWLHTGDIGKWLPNGTLKIIDRKKHIFKLAQGEYIAPEKIENIYQRSEPIAQVFVHGESLQAFLIAIVVPDVETLGAWAQKRGIVGSFEELCRNKDVKKAILEDMVRLGKESGLKPFEQVKGICLHPELFSIDNGLLTPTMKAKRPELRNYFRSQIDELYSTIKV
ncbi:hypothetical protein FD754_015630 [Muntiacus muntjak]|uniref:long-chain-fatty-acid--CoA ligase n=1 Tax=Muntiacus muntjak TaxID=9888 RepID=A0A5N3VNU5_MUNMU|nr:hypothetical protein FD754_015630 [Muntiacus muntjak]